MRRIVTGHDASGRAVVSEDGPAPTVLTNPARGDYFSAQVWATHATPIPIAATEPDPTAHKLTLEPSRNGSVIRVIQFPPEDASIHKLDAAGARALFAAIGSDKASTFKPGGPHPLMHRTESVDYGIVLGGEITLVLDDSEVTVRAGDVLVQRGTNHAWSNRSGKSCRIAFILIDGRFDAALKFPD
ncbi:MAG TPA: cupin domain-containing protein [Burkholderiales bacterium]|nr:cupin domain-containing protein [Burkholderiales bacterium]